MPSEADFKDPNIGKYVAKYLTGVQGVPVEYRMRALRLIENLTFGTRAASYLTESCLHGAGSPQAQKILFSRLSNIEKMKDPAKIVAGINS